VELRDPSTLGFDVTDFDELKNVRDFPRLEQFAPGLVAIKTPGHTPGHLMFFIHTADGREILYVGDLVWSYRNIETGRSRPRAVARLYLGEDSTAVADQLRAVMTFATAHPDVEIVVSHDADRLEHQLATGVLIAGLR
jgi:glyoxylase-like metal-dependent hydrolase (beta-lactamase superfamily II)